MIMKTAYDCWKDEQATKPIITLCKDFDDAIGGGIRIGAITELIGGPGAGKTQFCLQICINVQIPKVLCGLEGAAVFIETNCGFSIKRIKEIATATFKHCEFVYQTNEINHDPNDFNVETMMNNIFCIFCNNYLELLATIQNLKELLTQNPKIRLIVIDSFSYLFRSMDNADVNGVQILYNALTVLQKLANSFDCAILITNELTTCFTADNEPQTLPALGYSHTHRNNFQITLARDMDNRKVIIANIDKTFVGEEKRVIFTITADGIRPMRHKRSHDQVE